MLLLSLAWKSLRNRKLTTGLTIVSIALSVALLLGVENVRVGARESFSNTISGTDLIVGARGGSLQLLLYSVFRMGSATNNMSYESYRHFAEHPAVAWTIPYSLGDSHRGFRVVGTTNDFYEHYRFRRDRRIEFAEGRMPEGVFDVVLGSDVSERLKYKINEKITVAHGIAVRNIMEHSDKPFTVVGILKRTSTPVDRSIYVSLYGIEAIHIDWQEGAPPMIGEEIPADQVTKDKLEIKQITSFLLRTKSRIDTLRLQREISTYETEPLQAIIPGVALAELWRTIGYAEVALQVVSFFVLVVGLLGMLVSLYTSLNERRREMAILRAVGAGPKKIIFLLVLESGILALAGAMLGTVLIYGLSIATQPVVEQTFGIYLPIQAPTTAGYLYLAAIVIAGFLIGFVPALKAYRNALGDGLSVRL